MSREAVKVMRRIIGVAIMALVLIAGVSVFSSANAGSGGSSKDGDTVRLLTKTVDEADIDVGAAGESLGDYFVFTEDLFMKGKRVGSDHVSCMATRIDKSEFTVQCVATLVLDGKGQITVQGAVTFSEESGSTFTLAITGGTGRFRDASGQVKVRDISDEKSVLTVQLGR
jgi:hypothetical protein